MSWKKRIRKLVKKAVFGRDFLPQRFFLAQTEPQNEVAVWLHGTGEPVDVTRRHCQACAVPFMLCIGFPRGEGPREEQRAQLKLQFCERDGRQRLLGEIGLRVVQTLESGDSEFFLFRSKSAANYCLPRVKFWLNTLRHAHFEWKHGKRIQMSGAERRAMAVMFICPRPVSLVSVATADRGNLFPLNVMGDVADGYFAFCLKSGMLPAQFVEETRRVVLSSVPMAQAQLAYRLGPNHNRPTLDWQQLPFSTTPSQTFRIPVPEFACRVREMEVEQIHRLGHHTFFLARAVSDEVRATTPELCVVHGFYQSWRTRQRGVDWSISDAEDAFVRNQMSPEQAALLFARGSGSV